MPPPNRSAFFDVAAKQHPHQIRRVRAFEKLVGAEQREPQDAEAARVGRKAAGEELEELQEKKLRIEPGGHSSVSVARLAPH